MALTEQERNPHGKLVECRSALENVLKKHRKEAAAICNQLTHQEVEAVLSAGDDAEKMQKAITKAEEKAEPPELSKGQKRALEEQQQNSKSKK